MIRSLGPNELVLIRHAPVATPGRLFGRTDVHATIPTKQQLEPLRHLLAGAHTRVTSPALRCRQTAEAIWGEGGKVTELPDLWEQDFGDWEGQSYEDLPDIGDVSGDALAAHRPPNGESFDDVVARVTPALQDLVENHTGPTAAVVHAGVVRAALAVALNTSSGALRFEIDCLSVTRLTVYGSGSYAIGCVNQQVVDFKQ